MSPPKPFTASPPTLRLIILFVVCGIFASAKDKVFVTSQAGVGLYSLGSEKSKPVRFSRKDGVSVKDVGWTRSEPANGGVSISYFFLLDFKTDLSVQKIVIEDISDGFATVLLDDKSPRLEASAWRGTAQSLTISKEATPWVYTKGESIRTFRITVTLANKGPIELIQPLPASDAHKLGLQIRRDDLLKTILPPRDPAHELFNRSVSALLPPEENFLLIQLKERPNETLAADCLAAAKLARSAKRPVAIACENDDWAKELLALMFSKARKGSFKGMTLALVSPQASTDEILPLVAGHELLVKTGPLLR